jgi:hypothetical protein
MPTFKPWGKQDTICKKCKHPSTQTFETQYDDMIDGYYCIRYFERLCASCLYWSAWIWLNNGREKVTIDANL